MESDTDPFASDGFWRLSKFSVEALQLPWNETLPDIPILGLNSLLVEPSVKQQHDSIWKLDYFSDVPGPPESSPDSIIEPSIDGHSEAQSDLLQDVSADDEENIWALEQLKELPGYTSPLKSWEKYQDRSFPRRSAQKKPGRLVRNDVFIRSLLRLGLGWSSPFFRYNERTNQFERHLTHARVSGISPEVLEIIIGDVLRCGTNMQRLRAFAQATQVKGKEMPALFTLSSATAVVVYNLEQQLLDYSRNIVSLLQTKALFQRCGDLVGALTDIVDAAEKCVSEAQIISTVMERAAFCAQRFGWLENLVQEIVLRVTAPWFKFVEGWIGLRPEEPALDEDVASGRTFVQLECFEEPGKFKTGPVRIDFNYRADHMPHTIPIDQAHSIFESGRSLRLLKRSHPQHPIGRLDVLNRAGRLNLQCATAWDDIERIQRTAQEYECQLRAEILRYHRGEPCTQETESEPVLSEADTGNEQEELTETFELFDIDDEKRVSEVVADQEALSKDKFSELLHQARGFTPAYDDSRFGPDLTSGLYLSLAPIVSSQALLIDFSCLHHLFKEHNIRHHLNLQWRFQLLGDGSFVSRLSNSLFDPEMESGERKAGVMRSGVHTGLRLGSRDTWPPASSELRLVLIGLLGDCYFGETDPDAQDKDNELPGGMSFSIRELHPDEIERCKDPNAIEALDFLRLQYKPPEVLETIITTRSLNKYDRVFKHLLRLLRMVSVVKGLIRDSTVRGSLSGDTRNISQKFRIDAQHFVLAVSDYCFHIGVGSTWHRLQETLDRIERCLDRGDIDGTIEAAHSVPRLRDYHEDILDQMLFAFFLSKRHAQAAKLLDSIFSTILAFSPISRADGLSGLRHESEGTVLHLYATFRKQTSAFLGYVRGLDSGKASSKPFHKSGGFFASRSESTSVFEHLRVRLDWKEYY
ncbi:hypothetical protein N7474_000407 [Penicillium riverlandense]|uniref:uncharacterized protein n=1 Tax=Penicillium riverlandense TaxID=1903569 RepID=UPI002548346F|nr:uncharacterized protein N7474_000407 [Penicillium riverlandense]KAJ5832096.1 hypothetical protein N7474_000407 [Penicillium riverlandense]